MARFLVSIETVKKDDEIIRKLDSETFPIGNLQGAEARMKSLREQGKNARLYEVCETAFTLNERLIQEVCETAFTLKRLIQEQVDWIKSRGGSKSNYIARYGTPGLSTVSGEGGEKIWDADFGELVRLLSNSGARYPETEAQKLLY